MPPKPQPTSLSRADATKLIREAAGNTSLVYFEPHAKDQMLTRGILNTQVFTIFRSGYIVGDPVLDVGLKGWKFAVQGFSAGLALKVVVEIKAGGKKVIVITAYEDG